MSPAIQATLWSMIATNIATFGRGWAASSSTIQALAHRLRRFEIMDLALKPAILKTEQVV
jgi:hypothetical protein